MPVLIKVQPEEPLVDETLDIKVTGLRQNHHVTLVVRLEEEGLRFISWALYIADIRGCVNVTQQASIDGSYSGLHPMGLLWSMQLEEGQREGMRLTKRNMKTPLTNLFAVYDGHFDASKIEDLSVRRPLAKTVVNRWYLGRGMIREDVREEGVVGTFFIPHGGGPYPAVLDMFGTIGGIVEHRAALLASRGFATLALSYFSPSAKPMIRTDMEYYENAVEWLLRQPNVSKAGAGVIGVSKGFEMALLTAVVSPKVKAVAAISGTYHLNILAHTYGDEIFPAVDFNLVDEDALRRNEEDYIVMKSAYATTPASEKHRCAIPVEKSKAKLLLFFGEDDECTDRLAAEYFPDRLAQHGRPNDCEAVVYPGAGHLIEPPYSPFCRASYHGLFDAIVLWGGNAREHARAQDDHWRRLQDFFKKHLKVPYKTKIEAKL